MTAVKEVVKDPVKETRMLTAAMNEFGQAGYRAAKTEVIAREAQVSKGLLFHYFGSKSALYLATARWVVARLNVVSDFSVWRDAPDLDTMITRAMRYKIAMQVQYKPEFAFAMAMYGGGYPAAVAPEIRQLLSDEMKMATEDLLGPVLARMPMRPGITKAQVEALVRMMSDVIAEQAKPYLDAHPNAQVAELEWLVTEARQYMGILAHGFLAD